MVHLSQLAALGVIVLTACVAMSCAAMKPGGSWGNPYLPLATLQGEAAARLAPSGGVQIREVGGERFMNITGPEAAFYGHVVGIPAHD